MSKSRQTAIDADCLNSVQLVTTKERTTHASVKGFPCELTVFGGKKKSKDEKGLNRRELSLHRIYYQLKSTQ